MDDFPETLRRHRDVTHLSTRECEELDVWSAEVGWEAHYQQTGQGKFEAWFNLSLCHDLKVVDQYCNRETVVCGTPPPGHIGLVIPHNDGSRGIFQGNTLIENEVALMGPGVEGIYRTPPHLRMLTLLLPVSRLRRAFEAMTGGELDPLILETRLLSLPPAIIQRTLGIGRQTIRNAPGLSAVDPPDVFQQELEDRFVTSLVEALTSPDDLEPGVLGRQNRVKYVMAAKNYIESHLDECLGMETLTRVIGISPRTLEYAFREVIDTTPVRYVKLRRLRAARSRLLESEPTTQTVTRIALAYGFNHFGYFSKAYKSLFDESPSETLHNARQ